MGNLPSTSQLDNSEVINFADMDMKNLPFIPSSKNKNKYLYLSGNKFSSLPKNMKNIVTVDLSNNYMGPSFPIHIAKALSSYLNLQSLELTKNLLENLDNFSNSSIEKINLHQNRFQELPDQFFSRFPNLSSFHLDYNFLKVLQNQSSASITNLSLSLNCIKSIETSTLSFAQLASLDLSKNQISNIPNDFSCSFPQLQNLDLSDNFISNIPENDLDNFVLPMTLNSLNLSNNLLEKLPNSVTCLPNLEFLNIENNRITNLPQLNQSLRKLKASHNKINNIENQEFKSLKNLDLSCNELTLLPTEIHFPKLSTISVKRNKLKETNFHKILTNKVTVIDVSFNEIESIPKELFETLTNLNSFYAFFNKITSLPSEISNCKSLYQLGISNNPIRRLPKLPRSLDRIMASNCQIDSIDSYIFVESPSCTNDYSDIFLTHVDLSGNKIESFNSIPSIQILNLSNNCLRRLPSIMDDLRILDVSMNQIDSNSDSMPQVITGESLTDLNLSYNKLTKIPDFDEVPCLQTVELSGNPIEGNIDLSLFPFLKRLDITETDISIIGESETLKEIISSNKEEEEEEDSTMKKNLYINQDKSVNRNKSGYSEIIGLRNNMEDSIIVRDDLNLYCVCDGHGGSDTAKYASIRIAELFESNRSSFSSSSSCSSLDSEQDFIIDVLNQTESELKELNLDDGSTLCLASLNKNDFGEKKLVTANLGDARALIIQSDGKPRELTKDQRPTMRSEFERVHNIYGKVSNDNRVDGVLGVARSLGDFKIHGVGKNPDLNEFDIDENDKLLVIACDGVFDSLTNDDVAKVVMNASSPTEAAFLIRNAAFASLSGDNISVIVVDLNYL